MQRKRIDIHNCKNVRLGRLLKRRIVDALRLEAELNGVIKELGCGSLSEPGLGAHRPALVPFSAEDSTGYGLVADLEHRLEELHRKLHRSQTKMTRLGNAHASTACSTLMRDVDVYYSALKLHLRPTH